MVVQQDEFATPTPTHAPLTAKRRGRREQALAALYDRHGGRTGASIPDGAQIAPMSGSARRSPARRGGLLYRVLGAVIGGHRRTDSRAPKRPPTIGATAAAVAQARRITGPGFGHYFGTPFLSQPPNAVERATASDERTEASRHDQGIIDHSRHASSAGQG
jgi:hypothetical protein